MLAHAGGFVDEPCTIAQWPTLVQANVSVEFHQLQAQDDVAWPWMFVSLP